MARTCVAVCFIFVNLAKAVRTTQNRANQLTQLPGMRERAASAAPLGKGHSVVFPSHLSHRQLSPPIAQLPSIHPSSPNLAIRLPVEAPFEDDISQVIEREQLGLLSPSKKDTSTFILSEADDTKTRSGGDNSKHQQGNKEVLGKVPLTAPPEQIDVPVFNSRVDSTWKHASSTDESSKLSPPPEDARRILAEERPEGHAENQKGVFKALLKEAQRLASESPFKQDSGLIAEISNSAFQAYESLKRDFDAVFEIMRQRKEATWSYKIAEAYDHAMVALNQKRADMQQSLDQLRVLEDRIVALTAERDDLTFRTFRRAVKAYESLKQGPFESNVSQKKDRHVDDEVLPEEATTTSTGIAVRSSPRSRPRAQIANQAAKALERVLEAYESGKQDMMRHLEEYEDAAPYEVAQAYQMVLVATNRKHARLQRFLDKLEAMEKELVALTVENNDLNFKALQCGYEFYESLNGALDEHADEEASLKEALTLRSSFVATSFFWRKLGSEIVKRCRL